VIGLATVNVSPFQKPSLTKCLAGVLKVATNVVPVPNNWAQARNGQQAPSVFRPAPNEQQARYEPRRLLAVYRKTSVMESALLKRHEMMKPLAL
jgi:hypothetical protein